MHVALNETVCTYEPEGRPLGLITGAFVGEEKKGFYLKHLTVFPGSPKTTLPRMLRELLDETAPEYGVDFVLLYIQDGYLEGLDDLANRYGFQPDGREPNGRWWRRDIRTSS